MVSPSSKGARRVRAPGSFISIPVLFLLLAVAPNASADGGSAPGGSVYLTTAYLVGTVAAIGYKTLIACVKYLSLKIFRLSLLLYPMFLGVLIAVPTVFYALPHLGPPSGGFGTDLVYAFLTTYTIFDITGDVFKLTGIMTEYLRNKNGDG